MPTLSYNLAISDETLQAKAEELQVWNFAKKARKVITVLRGILEATSGTNTRELVTQLPYAIKYAGVTFSHQELVTLLNLLTFKANNGDGVDIEATVRLAIDN